MVHLVLSETSRLSDLTRFVEPVEIINANGKLVGLFVPANLERGRQRYEQLEAGTDRAETRRREPTERTGRTAKEIFDQLEATCTRPEQGNLCPAS